MQLAGTRLRMEYSTHYGTEGSTGEGSARVQHQYKVDPNKVRGLEPGAAYIISRGRAMRAQVLQAPEIRGELPQVAGPESSHGVQDSNHAALAGPGGPDHPHKSEPATPGQGSGEQDAAQGAPSTGEPSKGQVGTLPF